MPSRASACKDVLVCIVCSFAYCRCGLLCGLNILLILHTEENLQSNFCS